MQGAAFEGSDTRASASRRHEGYSVFDCGLSFSAWNHASPGRCAHLMHRRSLSGFSRTARSEKGGETPRRVRPTYSDWRRPNSHLHTLGGRGSGVTARPRRRAAAVRAYEGRGGVLTCVSGKRPTCRRGGSGSSSTITSHIKGRLAPPGEPVPVQRHRVEPGKKTSPRNARRNWYKYCGQPWSHSRLDTLTVLTV